ncbi:MAG: hypothetical protein ACP6IS_03950 [Candidatus Asgardarchaeia archaeon]
MISEQFGMDYMILLLLWFLLPLAIIGLQGLRAKYKAWLEERRLHEIERG